jgi:hypothetical protein
MAWPVITAATLLVLEPSSSVYHACYVPCSTNPPPSDKPKQSASLGLRLARHVPPTSSGRKGNAKRGRVPLFLRFGFDYEDGGVGSSETSAGFYHTTRCHIPEDSTVYSHRCGSHRSSAVNTQPDRWGRAHNCRDRCCHLYSSRISALRR